MRSPEGRDYWSAGVFKEIVPLERIVYTDCFSDEKGNIVHASEHGLPGNGWPMEMRVTVTFEDLGGKTKMTVHHIGHPAGEVSEMASAGWNQSLDKLAASLK